MTESRENKIVVTSNFRTSGAHQPPPVIARVERYGPKVLDTYWEVWYNSVKHGPFDHYPTKEDIENVTRTR